MVQFKCWSLNILVIQNWTFLSCFDTGHFFFCGRPFLARFIVKLTFLLWIKNQTFRCLVFLGNKSVNFFDFFISICDWQSNWICLFVCFLRGRGNQIQSPAHDFIDRRVNFSSAMHNYNEQGTGEKFWKNSNLLSNYRSEWNFSQVSSPVFSKSCNQNWF